MPSGDLTPVRTSWKGIARVVDFHGLTAERPYSEFTTTTVSNEDGLKQPFLIEIELKKT